MATAGRSPISSNVWIRVGGHYTAKLVQGGHYTRLAPVLLESIREIVQEEFHAVFPPAYPSLAMFKVADGNPSFGAKGDLLVCFAVRGSTTGKVIGKLASLVMDSVEHVAGKDVAAFRIFEGIDFADVEILDAELGG